MNPEVSEDRRERRRTAERDVGVKTNYLRGTEKYSTPTNVRNPLFEFFNGNSANLKFPNRIIFLHQGDSSPAEVCKQAESR